ncbi:hypothetical protein C0584_05295 [Candidatus Parcubacteria bacterium]|nr:MAG: hypothetical protein C0584_05295 [Candidatus Parcubacteria bacterium]
MKLRYRSLLTLALIVITCISFELITDSPSWEKVFECVFFAVLGISIFMGIGILYPNHDFRITNHPEVNPETLIISLRLRETEKSPDPQTVNISPKSLQSVFPKDDDSGIILNISHQSDNGGLFETEILSDDTVLNQEIVDELFQLFFGAIQRKPRINLELIEELKIFLNKVNQKK